VRALLIPKNRPPTPAGEMLVEEFLKPLGISQTEFARAIGITYHRLNEIVNGRRGVTIDTALRFSRALGTTPDFWLNLQRVSDLYEAMHSPQAADIARIKPLKVPKSLHRSDAHSPNEKPRIRRRSIA
jgi:addiction module HigA family antidote